MKFNVFQVLSGSSTIKNLNNLKQPSKLRIFLVSQFLKAAIRIISRANAEELKKVPSGGPLIICTNHINFLEVPVIQLELMPRKFRGFVKQETWKNPIMAFIFNTYRAIPVDRGGINKTAFDDIRTSLKEGYIIIVAPEGTRSGNGILQAGKPGIVSMALMTGAPILPLVHYGGEHFWDNFKHFRRTNINFRVGRPFVLKKDRKPNASIREEITHEIMFQMAELLPENLRGFYSDKSKQKTDFLNFI